MKLAKIEGLCQKAVCMTEVRPGPIGLGIGTRQYDHWNNAKGIIALDERQNFMAVNLWQLEVKKNYIRSRVFVKGSLAAQVGDGLSAVADMGYGVGYPVLREGEHDQACVVLIVLDKKKVKWSADHGGLTSLCVATQRLT